MSADDEKTKTTKECSRTEQDETIKLRVSQLRKELSEYKQQNDALLAEKRKYDELKQRHKALKKKNIGIVKGLKDEINKLQKTKKNHHDEIKQQSESATDYISQIEELNKRICGLEDELKSSNIRNSVIYKQYQTANEQNLQHKQLQNDYKNLQKTHEESTKKYQELGLECAQRTQSITDLQKLLDSQRRDCSKLKQENVSKGVAIKALETELATSMAQSLENVSSFKLQCRRIMDALNTENASLLQKMDDIQTKYDELCKWCHSEKEKNERNSLELKVATESNEELKEQIKLLTQSIKTFEGENFREQFEASQVKYDDEMKKSQRNFDESFNEFKRKHQDEMNALKAENKNLYKSDKEKIDKISTELKKKTESIEELEKEIKLLTSENEKLQQRIKIFDDDKTLQRLNELQAKFDEVQRKVGESLSKTNKRHKDEITALKVENKNLSDQLAEALKEKKEPVGEATKDERNVNELQRESGVQTECSTEYKVKYDELLQKYEEKLDVVSQLKDNIKSMTAQNIKKEQEIKKMVEEKQVEQKKEIINNIKYKIIESEHSLAFIKEELVGVTKRIKMRLSVPQITNSDADLVDVLLVRQKQMIQEYKYESDLIKKLNKELETEMNK